MLNLRKVLAAKPKDHVTAQLKVMYTPWGEAIDPARVLQEHPTPQFEREEYEVLNGTWGCAFAESGHAPTDDLEAVTAAAPVPAAEAFDRQIIVPFSPEAPLSGVNRQLRPDELLWYRRTIALPELAGRARCLLHFQAVDYACACRVNGRLVGTHAGGYLPFSFDITDFLTEPENELLLCVADPSELGGHLRGKQRLDRGDIWYTAQSGIWQTVWLEVVPPTHIERLQVEPDLSTGIVAVGLQVDGPSGVRHQAVLVEVLDDAGECVGRVREKPDGACFAVALRVPDPHPWSPEDPYLYRLRVTLGDDVVQSYCAFRTVQVRHDAAGHARVFLNGEPLFAKGVLDQGYWPDGLMTAPSDEALVFDIQAMRDAGFNLMRKHIKVESERWYYHCDRLGMLVLQDMVQGGDAQMHPWDRSYKPTLFKASWSRYRDDTPRHRARLGAGSAAYRDEWLRACRGTVHLLRNHPSVIGWCLFNEGWGQFDARAATDLVRRLDPTRVIDAVSGWYDQRCGDFSSVHNYFRNLEVWPCTYGRAFLVSEFGGYSHRVEGHSALPECYGYEVHDSIGGWRGAVRGVLAHMDALEREGLAGYVYTQLSDVEEELNGLLTYDRRVNKLVG